MYASDRFCLPFANFCSLAVPKSKVSMGTALEDSRGASPCLVGGNGTLTLFPPRCQTLQHQFQRDDNVRTLLEAIRDSFEIAKEAEALKNMQPASTQAKILDEMLDCVSECAKFIMSYAKDVHVGTSF
jgi:hypothetical protein